MVVEFLHFPDEHINRTPALKPAALPKSVHSASPLICFDWVSVFNTACHRQAVLKQSPFRSAPINIRSWNVLPCSRPTRFQLQDPKVA